MAKKRKASMPRAMKVEAMSKEKPPKVSDKMPTIGKAALGKSKSTPSSNKKPAHITVKGPRVERPPKAPHAAKMKMMREPRVPKPKKG